MEVKAIDVGKRGEIYAAHYLQSLGYAVIDANFKVRGGEIDLVAEPPENTEGHELVFVEVKTRTSEWYGKGEEAFNWRKQQAFQRATAEYLIRKFLKKKKAEPLIRKDFIEIQLAPSGEVKEIFHFEDV